MYIEIWGCRMGRVVVKVAGGGGGGGLVKRHDSYFAYNKDIWQDIWL